MITILICGDRFWNNFKVMDSFLKNLPVGSKVVHGDCRGADKIGGWLANKYGFEVYSEPAEWFKYGKKAGPIRNRLMLNKYKINYVWAFHDDLEKSKGTKDMVEAALEKGIPVKLISSSGNYKTLFKYKDIEYLF